LVCAAQGVDLLDVKFQRKLQEPEGCDGDQTSLPRAARDTGHHRQCSCWGTWGERVSI